MAKTGHFISTGFIFLSATSSPADCMGTFACSAKCKSAYKKGSDGCPKCDCLKFTG